MCKPPIYVTNIQLSELTKAFTAVLEFLKVMYSADLNVIMDHGSPYINIHIHSTICIYMMTCVRTVAEVIVLILTCKVALFPGSPPHVCVIIASDDF